jgi:hypothetical protein
LSLPLPGASASDLLNLQNNRMKSIALERLLFGYFFLAVEEKVTGSKGFESKLAWMPVSASACLCGEAIKDLWSAAPMLLIALDSILP